MPFNNSIFDYFWQAASVALILLGGFLLIVRRPSGFVNGLAFLALIFLGHVVNMLVPEPGNYSGVIHLAYLMAFPLLLTLAQRFPSTPAAVPAAATGEEKAAFPQKRYTAEPKTIHALMDLAAESDAPKVSQAITRSVAQTMLADLCFLVYLSDNKNQLEIASGYDLIREENLEGGALNKTAIPMLTSALQRGRALRLPASGTSADLKGLAELLGINTAGSILSVPIVTPEKESLGGVILLSPYSSRSWSAEDQAFLVNLAGSLVPIIQRSQLATRLGQETEKARDDLEAVRSQVEDLEGRNSDLSKQIEIMTLEAEKDASEREELPGLVADQGQSQQTITELKSQLEAARSNEAQAGTRVQDQLNTALSEAASSTEPTGGCQSEAG